MAKIVQVARFTADGTQVTREFKEMGDAGDRSFDRIKRGAQSIPPAMRAVDASVGVAKDKVSGLAGATGSLGTVLTSLGPVGIAAAAAIGGLTLGFVALQNATRNAVKSLAEIDGTAQQLGVSIETVQEFRFAMLGIGEDAATADAALLAFSRSLGQLNTEIGQRARGALEELGFTDTEIKNLGTVEQALPRIADRIAALDNAAAQAAIAQKLGLEPMLELLQQGSAAFDRAAQQAREMGYVIDTELIRRAGEFDDKWTQAAAAIDVQMKSALVDLAPIFVDLATAIAGATTQIVMFIDQFDALDRKSQATVERNLQRAALAQVDLSARFGLDVAEGGDRERGERILRAHGDHAVYGRAGTATTGVRSERDARDMYAALAWRRAQMEVELADRFSNSIGGGLPTTTTPSAPGARAGADPLAQARAFVQALEDERRVREDLLRITGERAGISREEAESIRVLERDLARLNELRAAGVIETDDELRALSAVVQARHDDAQATRDQNAARQAQAEIDRRNQANRSFEQSQETPRERMLREVQEAEAMRGQGASDESVDRRIAQITREYREFAAAQLQASEAGRLLEGVLRGQIRSMEDLEDAVLSMVQEWAINGVFEALGAIFNGGGQQQQQQGGGGGFNWGSVLGSVVSGIFGSGYSLSAGGGRAGGGYTQPGARHAYAEQGPEIAVVGGWGHVLPNDTFEGIAAMARMMRRAENAAPASTVGAPVNVIVNNHAGAEVSVSESQRNGMREIEVAVTRKVGADIASGQHDRPARERWGVRGPRTQRG
jgi:hypothetical protein